MSPGTLEFGWVHIYDSIILGHVIFFIFKLLKNNNNILKEKLLSSSFNLISGNNYVLYFFSYHFRPFDQFSYEFSRLKFMILF